MNSRSLFLSLYWQEARSTKSIILTCSPGKRKKSKTAAMPATFNPQSDLVKQIRTTLKLTEVCIVCGVFVSLVSV